MPSHATALEPSAVGHLADLDPLNLSIAGFLARYKGSTFRDYKHDLTVFLGWCAQHQLPPLQAKRPHLELYVRWLEQQGLAPATVSRRFGTVATYYKYAAMDELIDKDPCLGVDRPKVRLEDQKRTYLTAIEFAALLDAARQAGPREHCLVALLGMVGLRIGETCALDVTDIGTSGGYETVRVLGKGNKPATIPLPVPVMRAVRECIDGRDIGPLLTTRNGTRMDRHCASRMLRNLAAAAHIKTTFSPHSLRRTYCTHGLASGVPLRDMQIAMRHASANTTTRYDMGGGNLDRHASHRVASFLAGMAG